MRKYRKENNLIFISPLRHLYPTQDAMLKCKPTVNKIINGKPSYNKYPTRCLIIFSRFTDCNHLFEWCMEKQNV